MKLIFKYLLPILLISNFAKGEIIVPLAHGGMPGGIEQITFRETALLGFHNYLEHALTEYNRYYADNCYCKTLDFQIVPFYRHLKEKNKPESSRFKKSFSEFGALVQAQLNFRNFWLRASAIVGGLKEKTKIAELQKDLLESSNKQERTDKKVKGVDDVILKLGYNVYCSDKYNLGIYLLAGAYKHFKTHLSILDNTGAKIDSSIEEINTKKHSANILKVGNATFENLGGKISGNVIFNGHKLTEEEINYLNSDSSNEQTLEAKESKVSQQNSQITQPELFILTFDSPNMGGFNHKIGAGINGAVDLYECDNKELSFLFDAQYYYAIPEKIKTMNSILEKSDSALKITPGHTISFWGAFHYVCNCYNLEIGGTLYSTFKGKIKFGKEELSAQQLGLLFVPRPVKFGITPYIAASYNTVIKDCLPASIGFGVGYEYAQIKTPKHSPIKHKFNGFNAWIEAMISF